MAVEREIIAQLEADYPDWQIWVVHRAYGSPVWCARPWTDEKAVINTDSPDELREYLSEHASHGRQENPEHPDHGPSDP
jgi:hypothetical protein